MKRLLPILTLVLLASCTSHRHDDKMIFRYNESAGITTLDPAFAKDQSLIWGCRQLYNGLVELDSNLNVQPCIAKSWTISQDGLRYTFILRQDVMFHEPVSRVVTSQDFIYSFNRILDPSTMPPGVWIFSDVDSFSAPDDTTFVITLKRPFAPFLSQLGMVYCSVVPHEMVERYGKDFRKHPCGTGPFQFQYWKEGVKLVLRKNPHYFEFDSESHRLPYLDAIAVTFIVDRHTAFLEFVKGNLDFMNSLDASYKDEILTLEGELKPKYADRIDMVATPFLNTEYLGFNMESASILRDRRLRQAINLGFDRRKMMKYLRNNIGEPGVYGFIPRGLPGAAEEPLCEFNPEKARQLLAEVRKQHGTIPTLKLSATANYLIGSANRGSPTTPMPRIICCCSTLPTVLPKDLTTPASRTPRWTSSTSRLAALPMSTSARNFTGRSTRSSWRNRPSSCSTMTKYCTSPTRMSRGCAAMQ